jgi:hypothetical protein
MLSCSDREDVKCDPASDDYKRDPNATCGMKEKMMDLKYYTYF